MSLDVCPDLDLALATVAKLPAAISCSKFPITVDLSESLDELKAFAFACREADKQSDVFE